MKNMKQARLLGFTLLVSGMATPALAQPHKPTIIEFDAPGAGTGPYQGTFPQDINDAGAIIGFTDGGNGFVRNPDGTFTSFVVAGAEITVPESINSKGEIAGYSCYNAVCTGFKRATGGEITAFNVTGAGTGEGQGTFAWNINPAGEIVGTYVDDNSVTHGFVRAPHGEITTFDAPGAGTSAGQGTFTATVDGLNPAGWISGAMTDAQGVQHGFVRSPGGAFSTFDAPGAGTGSGLGTNAAGVNPAVTVPGYYTDALGVYHSYVRGPRGGITTFDVTAAGTASGQGTFAECINQVGQIPGYYADANYVNHGFVRAPDGGITTFDVPGAGTSAYQGTVGYSNNSAGAVIGNYSDTSNVYHGFLLNP